MKKLKYRQCEVIIKREDGEKKVKAYELAFSPGGLVTHKGRESNVWVITHKKSGLMVDDFPFSDTLQEALWKIKRLYKLAQEEGFSWNDSAEKLRGMNYLESKVEKVLVEGD